VVPGSGNKSPISSRSLSASSDTQAVSVAMSRAELQERRRVAVEEWYEGLRESPDAHLVAMIKPFPNSLM